MAEPLHVVLAADDGYACPLAVAARSVQQTLPPRFDLTIHVLDVGIGARHRSAIEDSLDDGRTELRWLDDLESRLGSLPVDDRYSAAAYARLLIPDLLPATVSRVLYLDCDVLVRRSVADLYDLDMAGRVALAAAECRAPFVSCPGGLARWFELGRGVGDTYFNSGVLLIDTRRWRDERVGRRTIELIQAGTDQHQADQGPLNEIAGTRIGHLDQRWNMQTECYIPHVAAALPCTREELARLHDEPFIVHFTTDAKPWTAACAHPWRDGWRETLADTAFAEWSPHPVLRAAS